MSKCALCKHYKETNCKNECVVTRDYCYPAHKVVICEYFEEIEGWNIDDLREYFGRG